MVDRKVSHLAIEVGHRIPASPHDLVNELISPGDSAFRIVDELLLDPAPVGHEALPFGRGQWSDVELADSLLPIHQLGFAFSPAELPDRPIVFRCITRPESLGPLLLPQQHADDGEREDDDTDNEGIH